MSSIPVQYQHLSWADFDESEFDMYSPAAMTQFRDWLGADVPVPSPTNTQTRYVPKLLKTNAQQNVWRKMDTSLLKAQNDKK